MSDGLRQGHRGATGTREDLRGLRVLKGPIVTTSATVTCPCGMEVELRKGRHQPGVFRKLWDPEHMPPPVPPCDVLIQEFAWEMSAAAAFTPVIECFCADAAGGRSSILRRWLRTAGRWTRDLRSSRRVGTGDDASSAQFRQAPRRRPCSTRPSAKDKRPGLDPQGQSRDDEVAALRD